ncbi:hypothetical protein E2C01_094027 [Portunus trituberculatus]|uniref:Uncharacterized protein n=1 Tax=Portunus trituberculatus TaxID=210409 RepID=A0A5B7JV37_PORTR|nr:hypothetical protein [Portunus trituberculatus]
MTKHSHCCPSPSTNPPICPHIHLTITPPPPMRKPGYRTPIPTHSRFYPRISTPFLHHPGNKTPEIRGWEGVTET